MIVKSVDDLRKHLGGSIAAGSALQRYAASVAEGLKIIRRATGDEIIDKLLEGYEQGSEPFEEPYDALFELVQRAAVFYGYAEFLPLATAIDGDSGLTESTSADNGPIRVGMFEKRLNKTLEKAASALEDVLQFLFKNADELPEWRDSDAYADASRLFVNSGTALGRYVPFGSGSYRLWLTLKWYLAESEQVIRSRIGSEQFSILKTKIRDRTVLSAVETELLDKIGRVSAWFAYKNALPQLRIISLPSGGLRILSEFDGINNAKAPSEDQMARYQKWIDDQADGMMTELSQFLAENADLLPAYRNSASYKSPVTESIFDKNKKYGQVIRMR